MNVIQRPKPREFCATMREYIIDTDSTITFSVRYGGKTVLEEEYSPDADFKVRTRGLGKFCELALWGEYDPDRCGRRLHVSYQWSGGYDLFCHVQPFGHPERCGSSGLFE